MSAHLLRDRFLPRFGSRYLAQLGDGARVPVVGGEVVVSTDTFVVSPLEFPGGNIGHLAVHGTVNDLAMMGATPKYLSAGFVLEEGLDFALLDRVLDAMAGAAEACGVEVVTGFSTCPFFVVSLMNNVFFNFSGVPSYGVTFVMSSRYCQWTLPQLTPSSVFFNVILPISGLISPRTNRCS